MSIVGKTFKPANRSEAGSLPEADADCFAAGLGRCARAGDVFFCVLRNSGIGGTKLFRGEGMGSAPWRDLAWAVQPESTMLPNHQHQSVVLRQPTTRATVAIDSGNWHGTAVSEGGGSAAPQLVLPLKGGGFALRRLVPRETTGAEEFVNQFPTHSALTKRGK